MGSLQTGAGDECDAAEDEHVRLRPLRHGEHCVQRDAMNKLSKFLLKKAATTFGKKLHDDDEPEPKKRPKRESKPDGQSKEKPKRQPKQKSPGPSSADQKSSDPKSESYGKK